MRGITIITLLIVIGSSGCGSSSKSLPPSSSTGQVVFHVNWPSRSRLIPLGSNSIKVSIATNPEIIRIAKRPEQGSEASIEVGQIPAGTYKATIQAFPNLDGTGVAQAKATLQVAIVTGQSTEVNITMDSTIDHLELSPNDQPMYVGQLVSYVATAKDAAGNVVMTWPAKMQWTSSNPSVARVDVDGIVTGVAGGAADINLTDIESGKQVTTSTSVSWPEVLNIYVGQTLSPGFDMGVNTSGGLTDWVIDQLGFMQCAFPSGQDWGVIFITVGAPTSERNNRKILNLSAYDFLSIDLKGAAGGERVSIGLKTPFDPDDGSEPKEIISAIQPDWSTYKIPLSSLVRDPNYPGDRFAMTYLVCEIVFEPGTPAESVSFRNIRFEKSGGINFVVK